MGMEFRLAKHWLNSDWARGIVLALICEYVCQKNLQKVAEDLTKGDTGPRFAWIIVLSIEMIQF